MLLPAPCVDDGLRRVAADEATYPSRQIRIVVGFAPGGAPDALARVIADRLTQSQEGGPWVVETRTARRGKYRDVAVSEVGAGGIYVGAGSDRNSGGSNPSRSGLPYA